MVQIRRRPAQVTPSQEQIDELHQRYVDELRKVPSIKDFAQKTEVFHQKTHLQMVIYVI